MPEGINAKRFREEREAQEAKETMGMGEIQPPTGLPASVRTLVLTFDTANGNFQVAGPITDKAICYGMLGMAHDEIFKFNERQKPGMLNP